MAKQSLVMVCIGIIIKSHKISGQFLCRLFSPVLPDEQGGHRLSELAWIELRQPKRKQAALTLQLEELQLIRQDRLGQTYTVLLKSPVWTNPEQVKPFCAWELWVDDRYASPCGEGEFLYCDLIGAEVYTYMGQEIVQRCPLGRVSGLIESTAQLLLEVQLCPPRYLQQTSLYLPFCDRIIGRVAQGESIEVLDLEYFEALL